MNLGKTQWGVYYLHDYVPPKKWENYPDFDSIEDSKNILEFKRFGEDCINLYSNELLQAISYLSINVMNRFVKNIALVNVPPSKVDKDSPIKESIHLIKEWFDEGIISPKFGCNKGIYDYSNLLTRISDVNTAHKEWPRPTFDEHLNSIECSKDNLSRDYMTFIILDDITTTGITMNACKKILLDHGANYRYIYKLAIGHTVEGYE